MNIRRSASIDTDLLDGDPPNENMVLKITNVSPSLFSRIPLSCAERDLFWSEINLNSAMTRRDTNQP